MLTLRPSLRHTVSFNQADAPVSERVSEYDARSTDASLSQYAVDHKSLVFGFIIILSDVPSGAEGVETRGSEENNDAHDDQVLFLVI